MAYQDEDSKRVADSSTLQWRVLLRDDEWQQATEWDQPVYGAGSGQATTHGSIRRRWWIGVVLLLVLIIATGGHLRQRALHNLAQVEQELAAATDLEAWAIRNDHSALVEDLLAEEDSVWRPVQMDATEGTAACDDGDVHIEILSYELRGDLARVDVLVTAACAPSPYRETRVYRQGTGGWQRTAPNAELWGPWQTFESDHFIYQFRRLDAATVATAAPRLDAIYEEIKANLGPIVPSTAQKLAVRLDLRAEPAINLLHGFEKGQLVVAAPSLFPLPADRSTSDVLVQAVAAALVIGRTNQVAAQLRIAGHWHAFLRGGLRLWQLWELDVPLATWPGEIVDWIYDEEAAGSGPSSAGLPVPYAGLPVPYAEMCGLFQAWRINPLHLGIPLSCSTSAQPNHKLAPALTLAQLTPWTVTSHPEYDASSPHPLDVDRTPSSFGETIAVATLIDYVVVTYGPDALPRLLAAFEQYPNWTTLVPATFGVSAETFEQGWQAHTQTY